MRQLFNSVEPADRIICQRDDRLITQQCFASDIAFLLQHIEDSSVSQWCLASSSGYRFAVGLFALIYAGKTTILPPNAQAGTLDEYREQGDVLLTDDSLLRKIPSETGQKVYSEKLPQLSPSAPALIEICTSGSSGERKRVAKRLQELEAEIVVLEETFGPRLGASTVVSTVSHQHIYGLLYKILWPIWSGRVFYDRSLLYPSDLLRCYQKEAAVCLISSPAHLKRLSDNELLRAVRAKGSAIFSSGSLLDSDVAHYFGTDTGLYPIEVLGSTETGGIAWREQKSSEQLLWNPLPGVELHVDNQVFSVRSPFTGSEWTKLGDKVSLEKEGKFMLKERIDELVKVEDKRFSPREMERRLIETGYVSQAKVVVYQKGLRDTVAAVVVPAKERNANERNAVNQTRGEQHMVDLASILRAELSTYFEPTLLPKLIRLVAALPTDEQGKVSQVVLKELLSQTFQTTLLSHENNCVRLRCQIPRGMAHFTGHFPGHPVVPGFLQLGWLMEEAERHFQRSVSMRRLPRAKFHQMLTPEMSFLCDLTLEKESLRYKLYESETVYSQGKIELWSEERGH